MPVYLSIKVVCTRCNQPFSVTGKKAKERARLQRFCGLCKKLNIKESTFKYKMRRKNNSKRPQKAKKARHLQDMDPGISTAKIIDLLIRET
jgi:hypothetical protein